jgi:hypothetical protein
VHNNQSHFYSNHFFLHSNFSWVFCLLFLDVTKYYMWTEFMYIYMNWIHITFKIWNL